MGNDLFTRLSELRKRSEREADRSTGREGSVPTTTGTGERDAGNRIPVLPGFERYGRYLQVKIESITLESMPVHAPAERIGGYFLPGTVCLPRLGYYDLETTGLSSGAGTVAFLAGWAQLEKDHVRLTQVFLSDYPGERELIEFISLSWQELDGVVSYNGLGFDGSLLRSRAALNGIRLPGLWEADLLYVVRALWKDRLESCSLSRIEDSVLGTRRNHDISGAEVPERYFAFHRSGRTDVLDPVIEHHRQDILSLIDLHLVLELILSDHGGETQPGAGFHADRVQAARLLLMPRKPGIRSPVGAPVGTDEHERFRAEAILRRVSVSSNQAARQLAAIYRRSGRTGEAVHLWRFLVAGSPARPDPDPQAAVELAKHLEHREHRFLEAADLVSRTLSVLSPDSRLRPDLEKRLVRLRARIDRFRS